MHSTTTTEGLMVPVYLHPKWEWDFEMLERSRSG